MDVQQQPAAARNKVYHSIFWMNHSSFMILLVRRVWIDENNRPIVRVTGSHKQTFMYFWCYKYRRKSSTIQTI